jgi:hypothetical protein
MDTRSVVGISGNSGTSLTSGISSKKNNDVKGRYLGYDELILLFDILNKSDYILHWKVVGEFLIYNFSEYCIKERNNHNIYILKVI